MDVTAAPATGAASNPNDLISPPKQVSVDQAPSPKEALQPEESKSSTHSSSNNQRSNHRGQNGPQGQYNPQKKSVGPPPSLPPPNIPLDEKHQPQAGANHNFNGAPYNAPQNSNQRQPYQNGAPPAAAQRQQQTPTSNGSPVNSNYQQPPALAKDNTSVRPVASASNESSGGKSTGRSTVEKQTTSDTTGETSQLSAYKQAKNGGLTPSEDFDMKNVKGKPPPRKPVDPTFRGWKEVGGFEADDALTAADETVDLLSRGSVFDQYLPAVAYGDWYHNAGFLIVGGLLSWIIGWFRFSVAPLFFVMVVFAVLYRASVKKYRGVLREQAQREFSVKTIEDDYETMDWCNYFLEKFWYYLEPSISQIVCDQANPILAGLPIPSFVTSVWLDSFTLGTKPPRIDCVKTLIGTAPDVVVMDWGFSFTPNANVDANNKQLKNNVNETIVVKATVFGVTIPVTVADVSFKGMARIRLRLMSSFPHVETVNVSMIEPPQFDFNTKLLGEASWWWEVLAFPGLYPFINEMVKKYVGPIVFNPMSFQLNVQQLLAGNALDSAIGVLTIRVDSARGLKGFKYLGNTLDPYLTFGFLNKVLAKTKVIDDTSQPVWNETLYVPVSSLSEPLTISVIDYNDIRKDRQVGAVQFDLETLVDNPHQEHLTAAFLRNNKPVGELLFGMTYQPVLQAVKQADGATTPPPDLNTGVARIEIPEARNLKGGDKGATTSVQLIIDGKSVLESPVQKNNNNPAWGAVTEQIIFNRAKTKAKLILKDKNGKPVGQIVKSLNELIDATQVEQTWFPLSKGGEVRISTNWKPVELEGAGGAGGYTPPIGVVRVAIDNAEDLRNLEHIGKVDPYARILVNGFEKARTAAVESSLDPTWNEIHYVTVSSPNQKLTIEAMDVEAHSPDRTLGSFDIRMNEFIQKDEKGLYVEHVDKKKRTSKLVSKKGPKGSITYTISFYPALPVMTLQDYKEEEEEKKEAEKKKKEREEEKKTNKNPSGLEDANQEKQVSPEEDIDDEEVDDDNFGQKLKLSVNQLIEYKSGILVFEILEGNVSKSDTFLQVFSGNHGYPDYISRELKKNKSKLEMTGDTTITELDWAETCFRLVKDEDDNRLDKCIAEANIPTLQLIKNGVDNPMTIDLEGNGHASFKMQFSWIPLIYASGVPPQDSKDNSGILYVKVKSAAGIPSSDSNGKSDPYMKVYLNTEKSAFTKTKTVKRTLDPTWNHKGEVEVANLYDSTLRFDLYDWDAVDADDYLGTGYVELGSYDMKEGPVEVEIPLQGEQGDPAGMAYAELSFEPKFVLNVKPKSQSTVGTVGNVGVGVGKGVGKGVGVLGKGVGKGLGGGFKGIRKGLHLGGGSSE
ncbi:TCB1 [Candida theae]|uniref:TCB1 n=1 Tax=Candida theae TaxID=1198502 RepID=A0AAD5BCP3_9ASCO|nr:TCB1 [Candida theae]KAI5955493.1 TCB1 [Candida theae]